MLLESDMCLRCNCSSDISCICSHLVVDSIHIFVPGRVMALLTRLGCPMLQAETAIQGLQDHELLDKIIVVDWAFSKGPIPIGSRAPRRR